MPNRPRNQLVQRRILPAVLVAGPIGLLAATTPFTAAQGRALNILLQQVLIGGSDDKLTITLVATGELSGALRTADGESKRLYIDLEGVVSAVAPVTPVGRGALRQIRVAQFSAQPVITRVVFDVGTVTSHRVEPGASPRELRITLESAAPRQAAPPPSPYLDWFNSIERHVGILLQATTQAIVTRDGGLPPLAGEWARVQRDIEAMVPPSAFAKAHTLLLQAARLARLEAERGETTPGAKSGADDDTNPRVVLARARAALLTK